MPILRFLGVLLVGGTLVFGLEGCGGWTEQESRRFNEWLMCEECTDGELSFIRDTLGERAREPLREILLDFPPEYRERAQEGLAAARSDRPDSAIADASEAFFLSNFEATLQRRAAIGLAALGDTTTLRQAVDQAGMQGYRADVVELMVQALTALDAPGWGAVAPDTVVIMPDSLQLTVGDTSFLAATVRDIDGRPVGGAIAWSSDDTSVAGVVSPRRGRAEVRGLSAGSSIITATSGGVSDTVTVRVVPAPTSPRELSVVGDAVRVDSAGTALDAPLVVRVSPAMPVVNVLFRIVRGTGTGDTVQVAIDASGEAAWTPTLGPSPEVMWVDATTLGQSVRFRITARAP